MRSPPRKSSTFISQLFFFRLCYTYTHERLKNCCISNTVLRPIEMITLSHWLHLPTWKKFGEHGCGWICKTVYSTWDKGLVHTYPFLFENRDIFSPVWSTVHTVKNGHRKRIFWKTLSRVEIFENAILLHSRVWMGENGGFWKQLRLDVGNQLLRMLPSKMVLFTTVIIYCLICGRAETIKTCTRELLKTVKNGYVWTGPKSWLRLWTFGGFFCNIRILPLHWPVGSFHCWKAWKQ